MRDFFYRRPLHLLTLLLVIFVSAQGAFWWRTHEIRPIMQVIPDVPGKAAIRALSFGDDQAAFRVVAINLQNFGDTFGRFTPLYKYDYSKLFHWLALADQLDKSSDFIPTLTSYYFAQTQYKPDIYYLVDYLRAHAQGQEKKKYWWVAQSAYLASHILLDKPLAAKIAKPMADMQDIPFWARQMAAFIYEDLGEMESAGKIIETVQQNAEEIPAGELNYMRYFVEERIHALEEKHKDK